TARFILGNLGGATGFDVEKDIVDVKDLHEIDKWALIRLNSLIEKCKSAYDAFDFHIVVHSIHNFCVTDMSNFYLDIAKDRLYCTGEKSLDRRAAQTTMYYILSAVSRLIAPVLSFTAEEIWKYMPHPATDDKRSIMMNDMPSAIDVQVDGAFTEKWDMIYNLRSDVTKALESKRAEKFIGASLEAKVIINVKDDAAMAEKLAGFAEELKNVFIVSGVEVSENTSGDFSSDYFADKLTYTIAKADGDKCERCWSYSETVGKNAEHPTLCSRCAKEVNN
ncbi:MAG: class I tRNA ligase family protein, partial [Oscillospiraceae bacterium]|nr:class I tRNA ligase family protein [Oscillospiraceae bacterium]